MTAIKKYSYMDWWSGKIRLIYSTILVNPDSKEEVPIVVSWDTINETDITKIKEKQKDIFTRAVNIQLEKWKEIFQNRFTNSELRGILLDDELNKFLNIMLEPMPAGIYIKLAHNGVYFDYHTLSAIKKYIAETKENGLAPDFDFIHSPNCPGQMSGNIPEVYAECCWEYVKWLVEFQSRLDINANLKEKGDSVSTQENISKEPENLFPLIFKNGYAYNMFLELKKSIVLKKTELADYSFIYRKMKQNDLQAIHSTVSHTIYISFLNKELKANILGAKLTNSKTSRKEQLYNTVLEKYKNHI